MLIVSPMRGLISLLVSCAWQVIKDRNAMIWDKFLYTIYYFRLYDYFKRMCFTIERSCLFIIFKKYDPGCKS
jgi:hypothetical protein